MTFHPEALDLAQLKRLSKQMQRGSKDVLPDTSLTLAQSQELLARALGDPPEVFVGTPGSFTKINGPIAKAQAGARARPASWPHQPAQWP